MMPLLPKEAPALTRRNLWLFLIVLFSIGLAQAEVSLPVVFSDGMLLQRDLPIHVWGHSGPAEKVSVTCHGESRSTVADELGRWGIYLSPVGVGGPYELSVQGTNRI